jgi:hypothetical protein
MFKRVCSAAASIPNRSQVLARRRVATGASAQAPNGHLRSAIIASGLSITLVCVRTTWDAAQAPALVVCETKSGSAR